MDKEQLEKEVKKLRGIIVDVNNQRIQCVEIGGLLRVPVLASSMLVLAREAQDILLQGKVYDVLGEPIIITNLLEEGN